MTLNQTNDVPKFFEGEARGNGDRVIRSPSGCSLTTLAAFAGAE